MCGVSSRTPTLALRERFSSSKPSDQVVQSQARTTMQTEPSVNPKNRIKRRRKLKSALFFALTTTAVVLCPTATHAFTMGNRSGASQRKNEWTRQSVQCDSSIVAEDAGTARSQHKTHIDSTPIKSELPALADQGQDTTIVHHDNDFSGLATKHYYARFLNEKGRWEFVEKIYLRIITELTPNTSVDDCDHTKSAASTLLLALQIQHSGNIRATHIVFVNFFRRIVLAMEKGAKMHQC